jgi:hypothetical protein
MTKKIKIKNSKRKTFGIMGDGGVGKTCENSQQKIQIIFCPKGFAQQFTV